MAHETRNPIEISEADRGRLLRLAYRFCWNTDDAEEALQAGLLVATRKADQLRDRRRRWPWLCRVVIQHCHLRGRQRKQQSIDADLLTSQAATSEADSCSAELGRVMRNLIQLLPQQQRTAVTLRHLEQMSYPDIALTLGVAESTARAHVRAGRDGLRNLFTSRHPEWTP